VAAREVAAILAQGVAAPQPQQVVCMWTWKAHAPFAGRVRHGYITYHGIDIEHSTGCGL
jgi:hypothetical protein